METEINKEYLGSSRKDVLRKELAAFEIACIAAKESKDPSTQVGACIVSKDNRVISTGFNHNPTNWDENEFPWRNDVSVIGEENTKYPYIIHAELDAISKCSNLYDIKDGTIYVTLFPCTNCAKAIVSFGIKKVVFSEYRNSQDATCAKRLLEKSGVEIVCIKNLIDDDTNSKEHPKIKIKFKGKEGK